MSWPGAPHGGVRRSRLVGAGTLLLALALLASGCGSMGYYAQSVGGHLELMRRARPVPAWLADDLTALLALLLAAHVVPGWAVLPLMAGIGFFSGIAGPSRDLLVRRAATARFGQAAYGRIYGFVYSGLDAGLAAAPLVFGGYMDRGEYAAVLIGIAVLQAAAILTALRVGRAA